MAEAVDFKVIGTSPVRPEGVDKVTGRAIVTSEVAFLQPVPECRFVKRHGAMHRSRDVARAERQLDTQRSAHCHTLMA